MGPATLPDLEEVLARLHVVGIPLHWGFVGAAKKGWGPNSLTPYVGYANIETPEYKAFLVNIEPAVGEAVS